MLRITHSDETTLKKLKGHLDRLTGLTVRDISYNTSNGVLHHARRENALFTLLSEHQELSLGALYTELCNRIGKLSTKTVQRDVYSLYLRGLLTLRHENKGKGRVTLVRINDAGKLRRTI